MKLTDVKEEDTVEDRRPRWRQMIGCSHLKKHSSHVFILGKVEK